MAETNFFRLVEQYFDGTITPSDKVLLEIKLEKDPLLKAEFDLQKEIQKGIADQRKSDLKARLASIDLPSAHPFINMTTGKWLAAAGIGAAIISLALLIPGNEPSPDFRKIDLSIQNQNKSLIYTDIDDLEVPKAQITLSDGKKIPSNENKSIQIGKIQQEDEVIVPTVSANGLSEETTNKTAINTKTARVKPQSVISYQEENIFTKDVESLNSAKKINLESADTNPTTVEVITDKSKRKFHYKYSANKLYLYGDFNEKPYQIIELNNKGEKQLFLYHERQFYIIKNNTLITSPLTQLKDRQLIEELAIIAEEDQ